MGKRKERTGEDTKVGPKEVWADTEHHFNTLKKKKSNLTKENWKVAMNWAQKVTKYIGERLGAWAGEGFLMRVVFCGGVGGPAHVVWCL